MMKMLSFMHQIKKGIFRFLEILPLILIIYKVIKIFFKSPKFTLVNYTNYKTIYYIIT